NLTGIWIEPGQATSANYWMDQMRHTVQFARGLDTLLNGRTGFLLEVGPNQVLTTMARQHLGRQSDTLAFPSLPSQQTELDHSILLTSLGNLWVNGFEPDWNNFYAYERRRRVPTPTYPFERKRYWVDMSVEAAPVKKTEAPAIEPVEESANDYAVQRDEMDQSYVAPRNAIEEGLAKIWAEILGMQGIGIHDNYFELGGDSLLATQMFSRIRQAFSVDISLEKVLFNQTIAELAREIYKELMPEGGDYDSFASLDEKIRERKANFEPSSITRVERNGELPLSFAQEQLWLIHQVNPDSAAYNLPSAVRLKGALDVEALEKSIGEVIRRHEILRTRFSEVDGRATQIIDTPAPIKLTVVELSELDADQRETEASRIVTEDARRPFDLAHGLAMRTFLLRLGEEDHVILLNVHHIASDAWSTGIFIQEIASLYEIFRRGQESPLPPLPIQYADYAYWQRNYLQGEKLESLVGYWKQQLSGASHVLKMPTDRPRPDVQTLRGAHKSFNLPRELSESLRTLSRGEGATLFMTLLSAFQTLLFRYSHQDDFCVGVPIAGRSLKETEGLIGCFINNLVLRARMSRDMKFRELLAKTREATLGAFAHQELPFAKVVEAVQPERSLSHSPLFQVIFDFRSTPREQSQELPELSLSSMGSEMGTAKLDLVLDIWDAGEAIVGSMEYNSDLFDESTITLMLGRFEVLLRSIVQQPDARLSALAMHTESEKQDRIMMESERESSSRKRLLSIKPKPIQLPEMASV
ncbi:MAG TPA: condensation domain-containing protein, partial [Pyrinomonadaceae bacterium]|nr:condensation domain-containing protein [Pyrinomonadaceae bacterium]